MLAIYDKAYMCLNLKQQFLKSKNVKKAQGKS